MEKHTSLSRSLIHQAKLHKYGLIRWLGISVSTLMISEGLFGFDTPRQYLCLFGISLIFQWWHCPYSPSSSLPAIKGKQVPKLNEMYEDYRHEADTHQVRQGACFASAFYLLAFKQAARQSFILPVWMLNRPPFIQQTLTSEGVQVFSRNVWTRDVWKLARYLAIRAQTCNLSPCLPIFHSSVRCRLLWHLRDGSWFCQNPIPVVETEMELQAATVKRKEKR